MIAQRRSINQKTDRQARPMLQAGGAGKIPSSFYRLVDWRGGNLVRADFRPPQRGRPQRDRVLSRDPRVAGALALAAAGAPQAGGAGATRGSKRLPATCRGWIALRRRPGAV